MLYFLQRSDAGEGCGSRVVSSATEGVSGRAGEISLGSFPFLQELHFLEWVKLLTCLTKWGGGGANSALESGEFAALLSLFESTQLLPMAGHYSSTMRASGDDGEDDVGDAVGLQNFHPGLLSDILAVYKKTRRGVGSLRKLGLLEDVFLPR